MVVADPRRSVKCISEPADGEGDRGSEVIVDGTGEERDGSKGRIQRDTGVILHGDIHLSSTTKTAERVILQCVRIFCHSWRKYHAGTQEANEADEDDLSKGGSPCGESDGSDLVSEAPNVIRSQSRS
jgi:hypothetical protein